MCSIAWGTVGEWVAGLGALAAVWAAFRIQAKARTHQIADQQKALDAIVDDRERTRKELQDSQRSDALATLLAAGQANLIIANQVARNRPSNLSTRVEMELAHVAIAERAQKAHATLRRVGGPPSADAVTADIIAVSMVLTDQRAGIDRTELTQDLLDLTNDINPAEAVDVDLADLQE